MRFHGDLLFWWGDSTPGFRSHLRAIKSDDRAVIWNFHPCAARNAPPRVADGVTRDSPSDARPRTMRREKAVKRKRGSGPAISVTDQTGNMGDRVRHAAGCHGTRRTLRRCVACRDDYHRARESSAGRFALSDELSESYSPHSERPTEGEMEMDVRVRRRMAG